MDNEDVIPESDDHVELDVTTNPDAVIPEVGDARLRTARVGDALVVPNDRPIPQGWGELAGPPVRPGGRWIVREY